nr:MAG TPA: hypothetical protein [Caudoviricetes sp.]
MQTVALNFIIKSSFCFSIVHLCYCFRVSSLS